MRRTRAASTAQTSAIGISAKTAMTIAVARSGPGAAEVTSNQASTSSSTALPTAVSTHRLSRRSRNQPVANSASASQLSRPTQASDQCASHALAGSVTER